MRGLVLAGGPVAAAAGPTPVPSPSPLPLAPGAGADALGARALLVLLLAVAAGVGVALVAQRSRERAPWVWWPVFGLVLAVWRMGRSWRALCETAKLSIPARRLGQFGLLGGLVVKGEPLALRAPRRVRLRVTRCGFAVTVRLFPGQVPDDYARAAEAMAHAWGVHEVRVSSPRPGLVELAALGYDPLRVVRIPRSGRLLARIPRPRVAPDDAPDGSTSDGPGTGPVEPDVLAVPVGAREDGTPFVIDLGDRPHWLITGATRSGKTTLLVALLVGLAPYPVALVGIDCKGGMGLGPFAPRLSALATSRREAAAVLSALCGVMIDRMRLCRDAGARSMWELPAELRPAPVVVLVDEIAELFLAVDREGKGEAAQCATSLVRLGQLGAALGLHLVVAGQRFGHDLGSGVTLLRAQLIGRACHRVADAESAAMTLAGLPEAAIQAAQRIPTGMQGVAIVGDDSGTWARARSAYVPLADAVRVAERYAHLAVPLPQVTAALDEVRNTERAGGEG